MTEQELLTKANRAFELMLIDFRKAPRTDEQRLKRFIRMTWRNIQLHTVNGAGKAKASHAASYFRKGIRVEFNYPEFKAWCESQRDVILNLYTLNDKPSIDRIDSSGHYAFGNIRILSHSENCRGGSASRRDALTKKLNEMNRTCEHCGTKLVRKWWPTKMESVPAFMQRKKCGKGRKCK